MIDQLLKTEAGKWVIIGRANLWRGCRFDRKPALVRYELAIRLPGWQRADYLYTSNALVRTYWYFFGLLQDSRKYRTANNLAYVRQMIVELRKEILATKRF